MFTYSRMSPIHHIVANTNSAESVLIQGIDPKTVQNLCHPSYIHFSHPAKSPQGEISDSKGGETDRQIFKITSDHINVFILFLTFFLVKDSYLSQKFVGIISDKIHSFH